MKKYIAMLVLAIAALFSTVSTPAVAMGQQQQVPKSNQPVPAADQLAAKNFNRCVSDEYSPGVSREIDDAMGKYRDEYTMVTRSITSKNLPEFQKHLRTAQILAADVGTSCEIEAPEAG